MLESRFGWFGVDGVRLIKPDGVSLSAVVNLGPDDGNLRLF